MLLRKMNGFPLPVQNTDGCDAGDYLPRWPGSLSPGAANISTALAVWALQVLQGFFYCHSDGEKNLFFVKIRRNLFWACILYTVFLTIV